MNQLAIGVPDRPMTPAASGCASAIWPLALKVVATGAFSARPVRSLRPCRQGAIADNDHRALCTARAFPPLLPDLPLGIRDGQIGHASGRASEASGRHPRGEAGHCPAGSGGRHRVSTMAVLMACVTSWGMSELGWTVSENSQPAGTRLQDLCPGRRARRSPVLAPARSGPAQGRRPPWRPRDRSAGWLRPARRW
jgi:hypothetical protein